MTRRNGRGAPRASQIMTAVLHAIAACGDVVDRWDVTHRQDGVLLRVRVRGHYPTETAANEAAGAVACRIGPAGYVLRDLTLATRSDGGSPQRWHAVLEVLVS